MTPARALAWEFGRRNRLGWMTIAGYLAVLAAIRAWMTFGGHAVSIHDDETFGLFVVFPLTSTILYSLAVFTFGFTGDIAARESMFPARLARLPLATRTLADVPMVLGGLVMIALWTATRLFGIFPNDMRVPVVWPGVLAIVLLLWAQGLLWMPYGARGMRIVVTVLWLTTIDSIVLTGLAFKASELAMIAFLLPQIPVAVWLGRIAVARARRGDVPDWTIAFRRGQATIRSDRRPFSSPLRAQLWFEWRRHGWNLPVLAVFVVPVELAILFLAGGSFALTAVLLVGVAITPPFLAKVAGAFISRANTLTGTDGPGAFIAVRPLRSASLVAATIVVTALSTLLTWSFVIVASLIAMLWSGTWILLTDRVGGLARAIGTDRVIAIAAIIGGLSILSTWRQLVQSLYIGLTGRERLARASVFMTMLAVFLLVPAVHWAVETPGVLGALWDAIPATLAVLVVIKITLGIVVVGSLWRRQVLSDRVLVSAVAVWTSAVLLLYGSLVWFWGMPYLPSYVLAMLAILAIPLARLAAAPLAFDWHRHR